MAASEGTITVKLVLDATEFHAELDKVIERLEKLSEVAPATEASRKAIAAAVRRNCTPSSEAYSKGGDVLIAAVADWIENPPEWVVFK